MAISRQRNFRRFVWDYHSVFTSRSEIFATLLGIIIGFLRSKIFFWYGGFFAKQNAELPSLSKRRIFRGSEIAVPQEGSAPAPRWARVAPLRGIASLNPLSPLGLSDTYRQRGGNFAPVKKSKLRSLSKHGTFFRQEKSVRQKIKYFADAKCPAPKEKKRRSF